MSILRDFEKRLEGRIEGFFARAFRSGLQPVELAKAVQRYASNYQQVGIEGVIVPNVYRFGLSPADLERFGGYAEELQREIARVVTRSAAENDWRLAGPVRIEFTEVETVRIGTYELRGKVEVAKKQPSAPPPSPSPRPASPAAAPSAAEATVVMSRPEPTPTATLVVQDGSGRRHRLTPRTTLGRHPDCELVLDDTSVSRRHAKVERRDGAWHLEDLGSTNGVKLNGETITSAALSDGDRLELGSVRLTFFSDG